MNYPYLRGNKVEENDIKTGSIILSNGTQLITQLIFLFPVPCSLFPVPCSGVPVFPLSTSEFNFVRLLTWLILTTTCQLCDFLG